MTSSSAPALRSSAENFPNNPAEEHVLVVPTALFHELGLFQGFLPSPESYLRVLLDPAYASYRPRSQMEQDPSFKQLIPYCLFRWRGELFHYVRGRGQGESRLHSKRSVGVGGHVSATDATGESPYLEAMFREIAEEVCVDAPFQQRCLGLINDDSTEVGRVHLGIVHLFDVEAPKVSPREESILLSGFSPLEELRRDKAQFETWSQICLDGALDAADRG